VQASGVIPSSTLRLDLASPSQRQALFSRLVEGQAVEARVLNQLSDGRWTLQLMGQTLTAESRQHLLAGQLVHARVHSLGPPLVLSLTGGLVAEDAALGRALRDLDLPDDDVNRTILRELIGRGAPVDRSAVQSLRDLLTSLPGTSGQSADADIQRQLNVILMLRSRGIPVTPDAVASYLGGLPSGEIGGLMAAVADLLTGFRQRQALPAADTEDIARLLAELPADADGLDGDAIRMLVTRLGVDLEGQLAAALTSAAHPQESLRPALLQLLARLMALDRTALSPADLTALDNLIGRANDLRSLLDTMQAVNLPSPETDGIHLQIPLHSGGRPQTVDVHISGNGKEKERPLDPDNVRIRLSVDLSGLGKVQIALAVTDGRAACTVRASDDRTDFLRESEDVLRESLKSCGYGTASITIPGSEEAPAVVDSRTIGIDVRA